MNDFQKLGIAFLLGFCTAVIAYRASRRRQLERANSKAGNLAVSRRIANLIFAVMFCTYAVVFGTLSILRHESFHSGGYDLGIFDQVVWNSLHGRLFENSIMTGSPSFLGHHFSPILLLLVPVYALWSDPRTLLVVQTLCLAIAGWPIYWFARQEVGRVGGLAIGAAYYLFPALQYVNLFEFHEIALATPLLSFSVFFLLRHRHFPFLVCLLLALLAKEEIAFVVVGLGMYLFFAQQKRVLGFALGLFGVAYAFVIFRYAIPFFFRNPSDANFLVLDRYLYTDRYLYLGRTMQEIFLTAITQPRLVLQHLLVANKIEFVLQLLVPLMLIPWAGAEVLALTLPTLGYLLIGDYMPQNSIYYHYTAPLIPFLFFALILGVKRLGAWWDRVRPKSYSAIDFVSVAIIAASFLNYYFQAAGPFSLGFNPSQYTIDARVALGNRLSAQIPANATTMAESNFVPHLSERRLIYQAPSAPILRPIEYLLADTRFASHNEYQSTWDDALASPFFQTLVEQDGYLLKKRAPYVPAHPLAIQFDQRITLLGFTIESAPPIQRGENISLVLVWRAEQDIRQRYVIFVQLIDANDDIWAQGDREPANGWFRTDRWKAGDVTPDRYVLDTDNDIPSGEYNLAIGLYDVATGERLRTSEGADRVLISHVTIQ